jgi:hypothetical protein
MQVMAIHARVQRELPEIMPTYETLMLNGADVRYKVFAEYLRREMKAPGWKCEAMDKHWFVSAVK